MRRLDGWARLLFMLALLIGVSWGRAEAATTVTTIDVTADYPAGASNGVSKWTINNGTIYYGYSWYIMPTTYYGWNTDGTYSQSWEWSNAGGNTLYVSNGGTITGSAETILGAHGNTVTLRGGEIQADLNMYSGTLASNAGNIFNATAGALTGGHTVDVGQGQINITGPVNISGNITTEYGTSIWNITAGTFDNNSHLNNSAGSGDIFNISGTANFDNTTRITANGAGNNQINLSGNTHVDSVITIDGVTGAGNNAFTMRDNAALTGNVTMGGGTNGVSIISTLAGIPTFTGNLDITGAAGGNQIDIGVANTGLGGPTVSNNTIHVGGGTNIINIFGGTGLAAATTVDAATSFIIDGGGNEMNVYNNVAFDTGLLTIGAGGNTIDISNNGNFTVDGAMTINGTGLNKLYVHGTTNFDVGTNLAIAGGYNTVSVYDTAQFDVGGTMSFTDGHNNINVTTTQAVSIGGDFTITGADPSTNTINIANGGNFTIGGLVNIGGGFNKIYLHNDGFFNIASTMTIGGGSNEIYIYENTDFNTGGAVTIAGGDNTIAFYDDAKVTMGGTWAIADGHNNIDMRNTDDVVINGDFTIAGTLTSGQNIINIRNTNVGGGTIFRTTGLIDIVGNDNQLYLHNNSTILVDGTVDIHGGGNTLYVYGTGTNVNTGTFTIDDGENDIRFFGSTYTHGGDLIVNAGTRATTGTGVSNTVLMTDTARVDKNISITSAAGRIEQIHLTGNSEFNGTMLVDGGTTHMLVDQKHHMTNGVTITGEDNWVTVALDMQNNPNPAPNLTGWFDLTAATGDSRVELNSGNLTRTAGSVFGSDTDHTEINLWAADVKQVYGGDGTNKFNLGYNGNALGTLQIQQGIQGVIKNLNGAAAGTANDASVTASGTNDVDVFGYYTKYYTANAIGSTAYGTNTDTIAHTLNGVSTGTNMNTLVNVSDVHLITYRGTGSYLEIGGFDRIGTDNRGAANFGIGTEEAQITANKLTIDAGSKFLINESTVSGASGTYTAAASPLRNIINQMIVSGEANINQTTIQGDTGPATITVNEGGVLYGFGEMDIDNNPMRANLIGNLEIRGNGRNKGGELRPFDASMYQYKYFDGASWITGHHFEDAPMGITFRVDGDSRFNRGSIMTSRLFAETTDEYDRQLNIYRDVNNPGTFYGNHSVIGTPIQARTYLSDSLQSTTYSLDNVFNRSGSRYETLDPKAKIQYNPIFGFNYELYSKQKFEVYQGNEATDATYYFSVLKSGTDLSSYFGYYDYNEVTRSWSPTLNYSDANHLFNNRIIKSDMLGEWMFVGADSTGTGTGVDTIALRFRLLASHPSQGGIAKDAITPNSREAARVIDIWRYPFKTDYSGSATVDLEDDPSAFVNNAANVHRYDYAGYDGDMDAYYSQHPNRFTQYQQKYVLDFEDLLLNIQQEIVDGVDLERAMRQLHAEAYADLPSVNLNVMRQFISNRERNSVSALYQVETKMRQDAEEQAAANEAASNGALASMDTYAYCDEEDYPYVCNPIRFWASGFGSVGRQNMKDTEYGWDTDLWGGSVGVIKECGDLYGGLTVGYARATNKWDELNAKSTSDSFLAEALLGYRIGMGFVEAHGNYAYVENKMQRHIRIANYSGDTTGEYHDHVFGGGLRFGYQYLMGNNWLLIPTIGVTYMKSKNSAFDETGRDNLSVAMRFGKGDIERSTWTVPIMLRLDKAYALGCFVLTPEVRAGFIPILGDKRGKAVPEYVGNPMPGMYFTSIGVDQGRYSAQFGASLELSRRGQFYLAGNYDFMWRQKGYDHYFSVQAGLNF